MDATIQDRPPWNKGVIIGQKRPLLERQVWSIRVRPEVFASARDLALFNLAIDSKLRASIWFASKAPAFARALSFAIEGVTRNSRRAAPSSSRSRR